LHERASDLTDEDLSRAAPEVLASLMNVEDHPTHGDWLPQELGQILQHQLDAPLLFDLSSIADPDRVSLVRHAESGTVRNFGALFCHRDPPLALLRLTKDFAKSSDRRRSNPLPAEVATVLYYAAIIAALLRHGERISRIGEETLREGARWVLRQHWVAEPLRDLFVEFLTTPREDAEVHGSDAE
jgi:hypothetical protein